jgi:hypothetical protein
MIYNLLAMQLVQCTYLNFNAKGSEVPRKGCKGSFERIFWMSELSDMLRVRCDNVSGLRVENRRLAMSVLLN